MSGKRVRKLIVWLITALFVLGCVSPFFAATPTQPAESLDTLGTAIVQTSEAAQTQTATFLPTATRTLLPSQILVPTQTLAPTQTPLILVSITPTSTPGFLIVGTDGTLVSVTPAVIVVRTSSSTPLNGNTSATESVNEGAPIKTPREWECKVLEKSPQKGTKIKQGTKFYASWRVQNSGTKDWPYYGIDFVYMTGFRSEGRQIQDLPTSISPGGSITLSVALTAPKGANSYNVFWSLKVGNTYFCPMKISFEVE